MADLAYDAVVVGAGPAGSATARDIASAGFRVLLMEEHAQIGDPSHCSGLISPRTLDLAGVGRCLVINELRSAVVHLPSGRTLAIDGDRTHALAIDRAGLDRALAERACAAGAELALSSKLVGLERQNGGLRLRLRTRERESSVLARLVIGADGAQSRVAKAVGFETVRSEPLLGLGAEVRLPATDNGRVDIFAGNEIAPGFFGWLVPLGGGRARLGLATSNGRPPVHYLNALKGHFSSLFDGVEIIRSYGGPIPLRRLSRIYADHVMLVGDAAGHVKPTSGGGIYPALVGAECCSRTAIRCLRTDELGASSLSLYQKEWQRGMGEELERGWDIRRAVLELGDCELDRLFRLLGSPALRGLISRHGDIDFPSSVAVRLIARHPWLMGFVRVALRAQG